MAKTIAIALLTFECAVSMSVSCGGAEDDSLRNRELRATLRKFEEELEAHVNSLGPFAKSEGKERMEAEGEEVKRFFNEKVGRDSKKQGEMIEAILLSKDEGFAHLALCEMVGLLAREARRDDLRDLLSKRCPPRPLLHSGIEDFIIVLSRNSLKDGTILLCDAFDKSADTAVRRTIAEALRRGFRAMNIVASDDKKLVSKVRAWYMANSSNCEPNTDYLSHLSEPRFSYEKQGVLVKKEPTESEANHGERR